MKCAKYFTFLKYILCKLTFLDLIENVLFFCKLYANFGGIMNKKNQLLRPSKEYISGVLEKCAPFILNTKVNYLLPEVLFLIKTMYI